MYAGSSPKRSQSWPSRSAQRLVQPRAERVRPPRRQLAAHQAENLAQADQALAHAVVQLGGQEPPGALFHFA
jgi:hypothetical protein